LKQFYGKKFPKILFSTKFLGRRKQVGDQCEYEDKNVDRKEGAEYGDKEGEEGGWKTIKTNQAR